MDHKMGLRVMKEFDLRKPNFTRWQIQNSGCREWIPADFLRVDVDFKGALVSLERFKRRRVWLTSVAAHRLFIMSTLCMPFLDHSNLFQAKYVIKHAWTKKKGSDITDNSHTAHCFLFSEDSALVLVHGSSYWLYAFGHHYSFTFIANWGRKKQNLVHLLKTKIILLIYIRINPIR